MYIILLCLLKILLAQNDFILFWQYHSLKLETLVCVSQLHSYFDLLYLQFLLVAHIY